MPAMPSKPTLIGVNQTSASLVLQWTKPATTNGPLKNFIIEMTNSDSGTKSTWETDGPVQEYVLDAHEFNPGPVSYTHLTLPTTPYV